MKIKIGDKITDPNIEPIMLIFDSIQDKKEFRKNLRGMGVTALKFCICPKNTTPEQAQEIMRVDWINKLK